MLDKGGINSSSGEQPANGWGYSSRRGSEGTYASPLTVIPFLCIAARILCVGWKNKAHLSYHFSLSLQREIFKPQMVQYFSTPTEQYYPT